MLIHHKVGGDRFKYEIWVLTKKMAWRNRENIGSITNLLYSSVF